MQREGAQSGHVYAVSTMACRADGSEWLQGRDDAFFQLKSRLVLRQRRRAHLK